MCVSSCVISTLRQYMKNSRFSSYFNQTLNHISSHLRAAPTRPAGFDGLRAMQTRAATIRFQAERKAGGFLGEMELDSGRRPETGTKREPVNPGLTDLGLTKKESHRFQLPAKVPEAELVELIAGLP